LLRFLDHTQTHPVSLLRTRDQLVTLAATYTTHNKHKTSIPMLLSVFEPAFPETKPLHTDSLDRTASGLYVAT